MTEHLVIMAAGQGKRMGPLTQTRPKPLLPVAGSSLLGHVLDRGRQAGFTKFTVVVNSFADQVKASFPGVDFVEQPHPNGTGHAVGCLDIQTDFVLASGDTLVAVEDFRALRAAAPSVLASKVSDGAAYGLLRVEDGVVVGVDEKVGGAGLANTGTYHLTPDHIQRCRKLTPSPRGEIELTDILEGLSVIEATQWLDAGRPWDLLDVQIAIMAAQAPRIEGKVGPNVEIIGAVVIEEGAHIMGHTVIEGPAFIGRDASIGPNAFIRPFSSIGAGCHVGNSCEIKNSILMDGANVPHLSYVGDSIIGQSCNLGAGTQVANLKTSDRTVRVHWEGTDWIDTGRRKLGCILGDKVKTGVNASLMPGLIAGSGAQLGAGTVHAGWVRS